MCLEDFKIIIELDGAQHFKQVRNWQSPEEQLIKDKYKMEQANINGYSVLRLLQEDVIKRDYDINYLLESIEYLQNE